MAQRFRNLSKNACKRIAKKLGLVDRYGDSVGRVADASPHNPYNRGYLHGVSDGADARQDLERNLRILNVPDFFGVRMTDSTDGERECRAYIEGFIEARWHLAGKSRAVRFGKGR